MRVYISPVAGGCWCLPPQDSLRDIAAQTQCVELMVCERLSRLRSTLADISTLEEACRRAQTRLQPGDEAAALAEYLQELRHEKSRLASALPGWPAAACRPRKTSSWGPSPGPPVRRGCPRGRRLVPPVRPPQRRPRVRRGEGGGSRPSGAVSRDRCKYQQRLHALWSSSLD